MSSSYAPPYALLTLCCDYRIVLLEFLIHISSYIYITYLECNAVELANSLPWQHEGDRGHSTTLRVPRHRFSPNSKSTPMTSLEIAEEIRSIFPGTEELIVQYISGYLVDDAGEEEDVLQVANDLLSSLGRDRPNDVQKLMARLRDLLSEQLAARARNSTRPKLMKLDKVVDLSKLGAISTTIGLGEGVDLESINKGK